MHILGGVDYEWDPEKARRNLKKHGVRFSDAVTALEDERALTIRDAYSDDKERWITLGVDACGRLLVVVYAWRGERLRLISARRATSRERRYYKESL